MVTQLTQALAQAGDLRTMAQQLGISEAQATTGADALLPALLGGAKKLLQGDTGSAGPAGLLGQLGNAGKLLGALGGAQAAAGNGDQLLAKLFGSKEVSRAVAQNAASKTGLDVGLLQKMLPLLAGLLAAFVSRQTGQAEGGKSGLGGLVGGLMGSVLGGSGNKSSAGSLLALLDLNSDGNALDDILRMAGKPQN